MITDDTVLIVGSAPAYPYGMIDPIPEMAAIASEAGMPFHVDACLGGLLLPFLERLGYEVPPWDFRVPGVTSISADVHKYGYGVKGASVSCTGRRRTCATRSSSSTTGRAASTARRRS